MQTRKNTRDSVYKLIYEYLFAKKPNERSFSICIAADMPEEEIAYINQVYYGVINNYDELIEIITKYTDKFQLQRIFKLDLAALLLAIYEMKYMNDIPLSVSISEAVELVKIYSTEKSYQFVNGILSSVYKDITANK